MSEFYLIAGMFAVTFGIRDVLYLMAGRFSFPEPVARALNYVPPAVLTAIVVPAVLMPDGKVIDISFGNAYLAGALIAGAVAFWKNNLLLTIVIGMAGFACWHWMAG